MCLFAFMLVIVMRFDSSFQIRSKADGNAVSNIAITLSSVLIWREHYRPITWLGLALAVISVILVNL